MEDGERSRVTPTEGVRIVRWGDAVEKRSLFKMVEGRRVGNRGIICTVR